MQWTCPERREGGREGGEEKVHKMRSLPSPASHWGLRDGLGSQPSLYIRFVRCVVGFVKLVGALTLFLINCGAHLFLVQRNRFHILAAPGFFFEMLGTSLFFVSFQENS
jgi:Na+-transporting NADH:ubiquinone oxidoreductase subunit NqrD